MLCSLTKRMISRREDTGRPLPSGIERHLRQCQACREFDDFCASLRVKSGADFASPNRADAARDARILAALKADDPRRAVETSPQKFVPVMAIVGLLAAVVTVSVWLATPRREPLPRLGAVINPERITALRTQIVSIDSPMKKEKDALDDVLSATVKFLVSRLDPGFGE